MERKYKLEKRFYCVFLLFINLMGFAQHFTVTLANLVTTTTTFEVDVVLIIDAPSQGVRLSSLSTGINYNPNILNGGTPCTTINCGSWEYIQGTKSPELASLATTQNTNRSSPVGHLRIYGTPLAGFASIDLPVGTYTLGRYRFSNTVPWASNADAELWLQDDNVGGSSNTIVLFYPIGLSTPLIAYTVTSPIGGTGLTLGYTSANKLSVVLNSTLTMFENENPILTAFPNPFISAFSLNKITTSDELINVKVFDMIGKKLEDITVTSLEILNLKIGSNYQSGFYNVIVSQDAKTQTLRVIKR
jgi:hypothetical protein